ncbi:uncharacterized protein LOC124805630 [Schistocerca piceifrons]|uniref:uncharacterized protein LOC124805630 n=1 Tax=Schistocerca piceifrons TaxID=274613 RepID=UPI001F5F047C|nr:uncharacterized protein LOC124805630 [Schistocerca piceifrons]
MRAAATAALCLALSVSPWWAVCVTASPVPSPVTPEDTSEVDNFDSRVSLTLEEMSALHSSTLRPHAPPVVKRSLTVESDPPPADNSDAVLRRAPALPLLRLEGGGRGGVPSRPEDSPNLLAAQPPPQPQPHSSRRRRQALDAPAVESEDAEDPQPAVPAPSGNGADDSYANYSE